MASLVEKLDEDTKVFAKKKLGVFPILSDPNI